MYGEKAWRQLHKNAYWTILGSNSPQSNKCTATNTSTKTKLDEPDMQEPAGEVGTDS